ncbi:hypothetical protein SAMN05216428_10658 [Nitrosospira sp. Nsp11]|uniref:hypothetical protein n=1 Tax=Nitrosospira sp. Nsp11 TaxID=1855338 RepID=UPI0009177035|nr:hypothetical protein [Nitrosospira sp. Nsp11]SHL78911.1 hypothetical protein SAMN05216428_10658 [Nitrosospira sp. Nsp11]
MTSTVRDQLLKKGKLSLRWPAGEIRERETLEDRPRYQVRQRLAPPLVKEENGQDGNSNTEPCQRQAVKTDLVSVDTIVGIELALFLPIIGISVADVIGVTDVSKGMGRLKDRDDRQRHH